MYDSAYVLQLAHDEGFELAGVCEAVSPPNFAHYENWLKLGMHGEMQYLVRHLAQKKNPCELLPGAKSILVVGLNYNQDPHYRPGRAKVARYALGRDYHKVLRKKLKRIGAQLQDSYTNVQFRICVDSAAILERDYAQLAGLGWYGKNTMLINSKRGSWFVIGLMILDQDFKPSQPASGGCGTCRACIDACPTGAIESSESGWRIRASSCISYRTIEHKGTFDAFEETPIADWTFGCDVCQEVCPFNQARESQPVRAVLSNTPDFQTRGEALRLTDILEMTYEEWDRWSAGSSIRRAGYDGIQRNARANLDYLKKQAE